MNRAFSRRLVLTALTSLLAPLALGCASSAPVDTGPAAEPERSAAALSSGPLCSDTDLGWRDGTSADTRTCAGPWLATPRRQVAVDRTGKCGKDDDIPAETKSCARPEHPVTKRETRTTTVDGRIVMRSPPGCPPNEFRASGNELAGLAALRPPQSCNPVKTYLCDVFSVHNAINQVTNAVIAPYNTAEHPVSAETRTKIFDDLNGQPRRVSSGQADGGARAVCHVTLDVPTEFETSKDALCGETPAIPGKDKPCPDGVDYVDETPVATGAGMSQTQICKAATNACLDGRTAPTCSTCEQAGSTAERLRCLETSRASALLDGAAKAEVARREKLVFELHGDELTPADRATLEGLYAAYPDAASSCGPLAASRVAAAAGSCAATTDTLNLCNALTQSHVPAALVSIYADRCLTLGAAATACTTADAADAYEKIAIAILTTLSSDLPAPAAEGPSEARVAALSRRLGFAAAWHAQGSALVKAGLLPEGQFAKDAMAVAGALAQLASTPSGTAIPGAVRDTAGTLTLDPKLARILDDSFAQETLRAFAATGKSLPPGLGAPLAVAALARLGAALGHTTDTYDIALSLIPLGAAEARPAGVSEVYALLRVLQSVTDADTLARIAKDGVPGGTLSTSWAVTLTKASAAGLARDFAGWAASGEATSTALADMSAGAAARADHLDARGMFSPERTTRLRSSLLDESETAILSAVTTRKAQLKTRLDSVVADRNTLVGVVLSELDKEKETKSLELQIQDRLRRLEESQTDTIALRQAQAKAELAFHDVASEYKALAAQAKDTDDYVVSPWGPGPVAFSADQVKAKRKGADRDLGLIGVKLGSAVAGDILRLSASGKWSPTCALRFVGAPDGKTIEVGGPPSTGPEGFSFTKSTTGFAARSVTKTHTESESKSLSASLRICQSISGGVGFHAPVGPHADSSTTIETCTGAEWRKTKDDSTAQSDVLGSQSETQLAFNVGVRSKEVPVPAAPVGSILVVQVPVGQRDLAQAKSVQVVREAGSSIVVGADADVYLLPNEISSTEDCKAPTADAVTVTAVRAIPRVRAVEVMAKAMGNAVAQLQTEAHALEGQGRLLPSDTTRLSALADAALTAALGKESPALTLADLPPSARAFFQLWTAQAIGALERTIELRALERSRAAINAELAGLYVNATSTRGALLTLRQMARWAVADADDALLSNDAADVSRLVREYLLPLISVRHPEVLPTLRGTSTMGAAARTARSALLTLPWTEPASRHLTKVNDFVDGLASLITESKLDGSTAASLTTVILQLPNPFAGSDTALDTPVYPSLVDKRRDLVWNAIVAPPASAPASVTFDVTPEDLYLADTHGAALSCVAAQPIVTATALYAGIPDQAEAQIVDDLYGVTATFGRIQTFVVEGGPQTLTLTPALGDAFGFEGRTASLKVLAGPPSLAHKRIKDEATASPPDFAGGAGLSPFQSVTLPVGLLHSILAPNKARLDKVQGLYLAMRIAARSMPQRMSWIGTCGEPGL